MGDWYFETAKSWEDLVAVHEKWVLDYNFQKHLAHEKREDGRHSPAEVLGWNMGSIPWPNILWSGSRTINISYELAIRASTTIPTKAPN